MSGLGGGVRLGEHVHPLLWHEAPDRHGVPARLQTEGGERGTGADPLRWHHGVRQDMGLAVVLLQVLVRQLL